MAITEIVAVPPACAATAPFGELRQAVPKIGPAKAARLLRQARVGETNTLGGFTERQRRRLIELLSARD